MRFRNAERQLSDAEIDEAEQKLGFRFPEALRRHYLAANGGQPEPNVFTNDRVDTVVTEFLPLVAKRGVETAPQAYRSLVLKQKLVPKGFFPFASDLGGDYFFIDCSSNDALVYLYRHDTAWEHLIPLKIGFEEFWNHLTAEDDT